MLLSPGDVGGTLSGLRGGAFEGVCGKGAGAWAGVFGGGIFFALDSSDDIERVDKRGSKGSASGVDRKQEQQQPIVIYRRC